MDIAEMTAHPNIESAFEGRWRTPLDFVPAPQVNSWALLNGHLLRFVQFDITPSDAGGLHCEVEARLGEAGTHSLIIWPLATFQGPDGPGMRGTGPCPIMIMDRQPLPRCTYFFHRVGQAMFVKFMYQMGGEIARRYLMTFPVPEEEEEAEERVPRPRDAAAIPEGVDVEADDVEVPSAEIRRVDAAAAALNDLLLGGLV